MAWWSPLKSKLYAWYICFAFHYETEPEQKSGVNTFQEMNSLFEE